MPKKLITCLSTYNAVLNLKKKISLYLWIKTLRREERKKTYSICKIFHLLLVEFILFAEWTCWLRGGIQMKDSPLSVLGIPRSTVGMELSA